MSALLLQIAVDSENLNYQTLYIGSAVAECLRPKGHGFESHRHHCVVSLSKTCLFLLSTGSTLRMTRPNITERLLTGT